MKYKILKKLFFIVVFGLAAYQIILMGYYLSGGNADPAVYKLRASRLCQLHDMLKEHNVRDLRLLYQSDPAYDQVFFIPNQQREAINNDNFYDKSQYYLSFDRQGNWLISEKNLGDDYVLTVDSQRNIVKYRRE